MRTLPERGPNESVNTAFFGPTDHRTSFCGHSFDVQRPPRLNCEGCWGFFFIINADFTKRMAELLLVEGGEQGIIDAHGSKLLKKLKQFCNTASQAKRISDEAQLQDVNQDVTVDGLSGGVQLLEQPTTEEEGVLSAVLETN